VASFLKVLLVLLVEKQEKRQRNIKELFLMSLVDCTIRKLIRVLCRELNCITRALWQTLHYATLQTIKEIHGLRLVCISLCLSVFFLQIKLVSFANLKLCYLRCTMPFPVCCSHIRCPVL
jgi:hypothetical protein